MAQEVKDTVRGQCLLHRSVTFSFTRLVSSRAGSSIPPPKSLLVVKKRNDKLVDEALVYFLE
jgi:hypothetical protein